MTLGLEQEGALVKDRTRVRGLKERGFQREINWVEEWKRGLGVAGEKHDFLVSPSQARLVL